MSLVSFFYGFFLNAKHDYYTFSEVREISKTQYFVDLAMGLDYKTQPCEGLQFMKTSPFLAMLSITALPLYALGVIVDTLKSQLNIQQRYEKISSNQTN